MSSSEKKSTRKLTSSLLRGSVANWNRARTACSERPYLRDANLRGANLRGANLRGANLCGADLCGANLCDANLCGADLCDANLCDANLFEADLCDANLRGANLFDADLCEANLRDANLRGANLRGAHRHPGIAIDKGIDQGSALGYEWLAYQSNGKVYAEIGCHRQARALDQWRAALPAMIKNYSGADKEEGAKAVEAVLAYCSIRFEITA